MTTDTPPPRLSPGVVVLLGLRFLLELALWASFAVAAVRLVDGPAGWVVGLLGTAAATAVWGLLLSPRRRIRLPLPARVGIELALFAVAAALLAASGLTTAAVALMVAELVVLGLLQGPDKHAV